MFFLTPYKILWQTITIVCLSLNTFHSALHGQAGFGVVGEGQCANCTDCCAYIGVDEQVELEAELTPKDEIANDSEIVWSASGPVGANMKFNGAAYNPNNPPTGKSVNFETDTAGDYTISSFCKSCGGASVCLKAIGECLMGWGHWTIPPAWTNNGDGTYTTPGPIGGAHPLSNYMQGPDVPRGFVLIIEFSFDPNETPPFPGAPFHATRPTFYGNSGVLAHGLYEIQIVDNNRMSKKVGNVITQELLQVNRFCRLSAPNVLADADLTPAMLASDQTHWNPNVATNLIRPRLQANSGDNLMAIVTGRPVSVFDDAKANLGDPDDNATDAQIQAMARPVGIGGTWPPTNICDPSRLNTGWISALENPLAVPYKHRADGVPTNHANKPGNQWNTMRVDFTPCCYEKKLIGQQTVYEKKRNACFSTKVNGTGMFNGELETGTRSWTNRNGVRVERNAYDAANPNTSVQLMAHWGSTVKFRNPKVYPK